MRQRYTTLVLHLSSYVERKKQALLTRHGWKSFFDVWLLILAELLFAIVSLPLLLVAKPMASEAGSRRYAVRRVLTIGMLASVIILWGLKIALIFVRQWQEERIVNVRQATEEEAQAFAMPVIAAAPIEPSLAIPVITGLSPDGRTGWTVRGTAPANSVVALYVTRMDGAQESVDVYLGTTEADGRFSIDEDPGRFRIKSGEYAMQAFAYDSSQGQKSAGSNVVKASVPDRPLEAVLHRADAVINVAVGLIIACGLFLTILLL